MALGFSLSPAVTVREINLTGSVPNLPSARTGMVLRADQGPALDIVAITNENDLVSKFGKPNAYNYQDWFACWNFLQYASSLYVVRPIDANGTVQNAGVGLTGTGAAVNVDQENLYNKRVAENTLENFADLTSKLYFFNREITSNQRLAVAVCSSPQYFKSPIGLEYYAVVSAAGADGTPTVTADGTPNLTTGSQVILNGNKLAVVNSVTQTTSGSAEIVFNRNVSASDVDRFYALATSATAAITGTTPAKWLGYFAKAGFTFKEGTTFNGAIVTNIANANTTEYAVTFEGNPAVTAGQICSSNTITYRGTTAYKNGTVGFGIEAGDTEIKLQPGFILEPGVEIAVGTVTGLYVASVDKVLNKITLVSPAPSAYVYATSGVQLDTSSPITLERIIVGINYFDKVYDSGLIQRTRVSVTDVANNTVSVVAQSLVTFNKVFEYPPNYANDEFAVVILRKNDDGFYESFEEAILSYKAGAKDAFGANIFAETAVFDSFESVYCKVGGPTLQRVDTAPTALPKIVSAQVSATIYPQKTEYGKIVYDGFGYTQGDIDQAYSLFSDPESFDVNILVCHQLDTNYASTIAETRKDCIAIVAPYNYSFLTTKSNTDCTQYLLDNFGSQVEYDGKIFTTFGTYSAVYGNMKYQYDKFNNVNRWINVAGDIAGLYAQTDNTNDPWWAPAGTTRGVIKNAIKLAFNPNKQNRDEMYVNSINPVMAVAGEGSAVVWGQKTATAVPSAFDRVNVRRLLIFLEKTIATSCNAGLFEFNDAFTRTRLFNIIDPFLRTVQSRRGLYAYKLVIDESNNTNQVIDANGLVVDIYLQPTKVAEFIRLSAIVVPTGASFSEYVGSF